MSEESNFQFEQVKFKKRATSKIIEDAKNIDPQQICNEVLLWTICNVENFIDNQNKMFKLDMIVDEVKGMEETKKLQDLYRAINDEKKSLTDKELEKTVECRRMLDGITAKSFEHMKNAPEMLQRLFGRMIFFYEKIIPNAENKKAALALDEDLKKLFKQKEESSPKKQKEIQKLILDKIKEGESLVKFTQLEGGVSISNFDYEAFDVGVQIKASENDLREGGDKKVIREYNIPEGFTLWIEINYKHKQRPTNMF